MIGTVLLLLSRGMSSGVFSSDAHLCVYLLVPRSRYMTRVSFPSFLVKKNEGKRDGKKVSVWGTMMGSI